MAVGAVFSQLIPLAAAPVLTRLYSPEAFGLFSSFFAVAAILAIPSTLRLELALMLPSSDIEAASLAAGAILSAIAFFVGLTGIALLVNIFADDLSNLHPLGGWLFFVPLMTLCISIQSILMGIANRRRKYEVIVLGNVSQQLVAVLSSIAFGLLGMHAGGLIASRIGAFTTGGLALGLKSTRGFFCGWRTVHSSILGLLRRYRQFPLFNVPYSLSGLLSRDFPILALTSFGYTAVAGQFAIARMAASLPGSFLTSSLGSVFYREAVEHLGNAQFTALTWNLSKALALMVIPPFLVLDLWGGDVFSLVFGESWRGAGDIFGLIALPFALSVLTGWPERVFEVRAKQQWSLLIQVGFDLTTVGVVLGMLIKNADAQSAIKVYASLQTAYQLTYLAAVFILTGLGWRRYLTILGTMMGAVALMLAINSTLALEHWFDVSQRAFALVAMAATVSAFGAKYLFNILMAESTST